MNYSEFKEYQKTLETDQSLIRFDDLNPFEINLNPEPNCIAYDQWIESKLGDRYFYHYGKGVREMLHRILNSLKDKCDTLILPNDVYPVYHEIGKHYIPNIYSVATLSGLKLQLPQSDNVLLLLPYPLIPAGRYWTSNELNGIDHWLNQGKNRYLIIDACYNFTMKSILNCFESENVLELFSASKLFLQNKSAGVIVSKQSHDEWKSPESVLKIAENSPIVLTDKFKNTWLNHRERIRKISSSWQCPDVGYLSTIPCSYQYLRTEYKIAAIPVSVFGSTEENYSALSILSFLK